MSNSQPKIIVLDDDPTGSQTVHSCLLLMKWDVETLKIGLLDDVPIVFILTNTRAISPNQAQQITIEVCQNLKQALQETQIDNYLVVSRSDSTLRGHYPVETDAIAKELGKFDAHFLTPAFFEGGRVTKNSTHYLLTEGILTPVHETEFARDSVFAYSHSYLPEYVAEKTDQRILAQEVIKLSLEDLRSDNLSEQLLQLQNNQCVVVDGEVQEDFDLFSQAILAASSQGKKFLFRSAASLLTSLSQLGSQPIVANEMSAYKPTTKSGVILVGSHVNKTTRQLNQLLQEKDVDGIEIDVVRLRDFPAQKAELLAEALTKVNLSWQQLKTPVIFTSRQELDFSSIQQRLDFGVRGSSLLMDLVKGLPSEIAFLISKGGITSNDVLSDGLKLDTVRLLGQILPGVSVVRTAENHSQFPHLPVVLFPGNVGSDNDLVMAWQRLVGRV